METESHKSPISVGRQHIQVELERRCQTNPKYSMRSFARAIGLSHTQLSLIMSGKRPMSEHAALQIAEHLQLPDGERLDFVHHRNHRSNPEESRTELSLDQFAMIADWYHIAILSLLELPPQRWSFKRLSSRLNISEVQVKLAVERLIRLGQIETSVQYGWRRSDAPLRFNNQTSSTASRQFQNQILEKAGEALDELPSQERHHSAMTMLLNRRDIPKLHSRIQQMRRQLCDEFETKNGDEQVHALSVQLFPLSKGGEI